MQDLQKAQKLAAVTLEKEQARQAMYYIQRNVRRGSNFRDGQLVWVYRPAKGPGITKFGHRWRGPGPIVEAANYDNYLVQMLESGHELVIHCSFLLSYYYPTHLLEEMAEDMALNLRDEAIAAADEDSEEEGSSGTRIRQEETQIDRRRPTDVSRTPVAAIVDSPVVTRDQYGAERKSESDDEPEGIGGQQEPDGEPEPATANGRWQREHEERRVGHEERDGNIASRARSKIRRAPYRRTEREDAEGREQKSPGALERAKREQYLWDQKVKAALVMAEEVKAANKLREHRGVKRSAADMYDDESSTNSRSLSENSDGPPTKKMKSRVSMSLPIEVVEELIASYLHTYVSPELDLPTPWWSVEGEGTDAVRGVTYWNSKWSAWEIDMTEEDQSDCGSTSKTLSICGAKEDFGSERDDDRGGQRDRSGATTRDSSRTAATD
ncbi:hypothetical protein GN244_ATG10474 [Phytophthora infestans]|uniref:Uncharacterized protein n=1 Tax=Phytophthora infestans TaxID=4787 RepID=A0A833WCQ2_PHYIN|nr:hypothetical protein GN244_ATG10474 [Phytophthora infestans]